MSKLISIPQISPKTPREEARVLEALAHNLEVITGRRGALPAIPGNVPDPYHLPPGCSFSIRCKHAQAGVCDAAVPELEDIGALHSVRCARWQDISTQGRP